MENQTELNWFYHSVSEFFSFQKPELCQITTNLKFFHPNWIKPLHKKFSFCDENNGFISFEVKKKPDSQPKNYGWNQAGKIKITTESTSHISVWKSNAKSVKHFYKINAKKMYTKNALFLYHLSKNLDIHNFCKVFFFFFFFFFL